MNRASLTSSSAGRNGEESPVIGVTPGRGRVKTNEGGSLCKYGLCASGGGRTQLRELQ